VERSEGVYVKSCAEQMPPIYLRAGTGGIELGSLWVRTALAFPRSEEEEEEKKKSRRRRRRRTDGVAGYSIRAGSATAVERCSV
jgi:hypothetical protein